LSALAFTSPLVLGALALLPVIWWLLRLTPPRPQTEVFPPFALLLRLVKRDETPSRSPWWLTLLRLAMAALAIVAMSGPIWNPQPDEITGEGSVLVVVDDGWASGADWQARQKAARALIERARDANRPVLIAGTVDDGAPVELLDADSALGRIEAMQPKPLLPDHARTAQRLAEAFANQVPGAIHFFSDGLAREGTEALAQIFASATGSPVIHLPENNRLSALAGVRNDPEALSGTVLRPKAGEEPVEVVALDAKGLAVARQRVDFGAGETSAKFQFSEPVELRNQVMRVAVTGANSAGAVQLLDDSFRRRVVGLVSGESSDLAQPLLSPLHYISRALAPFSDIRESDNANLSQSLELLINQGVAAIVLADIGHLPSEEIEKLSAWVERGGMLIRFAGPRLAASADELLPVELRAGDRNLGGALSWETPKPVAPFEINSPFYGIDAPREVTVRRQVLAVQDGVSNGRTWATLEDGTPLVTAAPRKAGWIVLFHTSSDASWSNLAISGTFVEMLRRVVGQARIAGGNGQASEANLPPLSILDGFGRLGAPDFETKPLVVAPGLVKTVTRENPPGLYGTDDGFVALNLFTAVPALKLIDTTVFGASVQVRTNAIGTATPLRPWLLLAAAILLLPDCLAVLWIAGALKLPARRPGRGAAAAATVALALLVSATAHSRAQSSNDVADFSAALATRLAYVVTGDGNVDAVSRAGLFGLSQFIGARTALEPGEPAAVDIASDELAFYPLLYWPIVAGGTVPDAATMARVDAYMKQGGTILFDTRDQLGGVLGGTASSPEAIKLQAILADLDIPPLEPAPPDHVLTKSFYLLSTFPGRYSGGDLWVEALPPATDSGVERPARAGDGVSSILVTGNDMAGAWAVDDSLRPMFPTVPPDPVQREIAYRVGVNIAMYVLTGNYKADQVHIPALLERLGQ
jgi:hypothetical protein